MGDVLDGQLSNLLQDYLLQGMKGKSIFKTDTIEILINNKQIFAGKLYIQKVIYSKVHTNYLILSKEEKNAK